MRLAIIDLGTNSVRFDIHELREGHKSTLLHREKLMVRLGQGVFLKGTLDKDAKLRTLTAFINFRKTMRSFQVTKTVAFATATLREARDGAKFIEKLYAQSGIEIKIISGSEEAKLIAQGILKNEKALKGQFALVDIGGGSIEVNLCKKSNITHSESFKVGAAKLQQVFLKSSPPKKISKNDDPIQRLREHVRQVFAERMKPEDQEAWPKVARIIGSSGTIKSLAKILSKKESSKKILRKDLSQFIQKISQMNTLELLQVPKMEPKRVDMILAGAILLDECMKALSAKVVTVTEFALRDGILSEEVSLFKGDTGQHLLSQLPLLQRKVAQFGGNKTHIAKVLENTDFLFDRLKRVHKLDSSWKPFLSAAAILHDTGDAINPTQHGIHSYYIIKNADLSSIEEWEKEFIARLCLYHAQSKLPEKALSIFGTKERKQAFKYLLSLLQVADALDRGHKAKVKISHLSLRQKEIHLFLHNRKNAELEILRLEHKKQLFEKSFKRKLIVSN